MPTPDSPSISHTFAAWGANLDFDDLPDAVVDKVKGLLLYALIGGVIGRDLPRVQKVIDLFAAEEGKPDGATILGTSTKLTRSAAAFVNAEVMHAAGLIDSYRMLTHPGPVLVGAALTNAEIESSSPRELLTSLAAGYEFECRLAHDFTPAIAARGFRPAPMFSTLGASMVAAKLLKLDADQLAVTIAIAANTGSGLNEAGRAGGGEDTILEANAARQGTAAALMASLNLFPGSTRVMEGASGFYRAYAGLTGTTISPVFTGPHEIDLGSLTADLGERWQMLDVMFRMYSSTGFTQPVIELLAEMRHDNDIDPAQIDEIVVSMNYLETTYPSPEFARVDGPGEVWAGSTDYYAAYVAVHGSYPVVGQPAAVPLSQDPAVVAMRERVTVRGVYDYPMFSPSIVISMKGGAAYTGRYPYSRMGGWRFDRVAAELSRCVAGIPGGQRTLDELVAVVKNIDEFNSMRPVFEVFRP